MHTHAHTHTQTHVHTIEHQVQRIESSTQDGGRALADFLCVCACSHCVHVQLKQFVHGLQKLLHARPHFGEVIPKVSRDLKLQQKACTCACVRICARMCACACECARARVCVCVCQSLIPPSCPIFRRVRVCVLLAVKTHAVDVICTVAYPGLHNVVCCSTGRGGVS